MFDNQFNLVAEIREKYADKFVYQQPQTPLNLIKEITASVSAAKTARVLVMFTVEWALYLSHTGYENVVVCSDNDATIEGLCKVLGLKYCNLSEINNNKMKFDVVVGNPPYSGDLHLKFLKTAFELSTDCVAFVHPAAWLVKLSEKSAIEQQCVELVKQHNTTFKFIKGKYYFGVAQYAPCSITIVDKHSLPAGSKVRIYDESCDRTWLFDSVDQINVLSDHPTFYEVKSYLQRVVTESIADIYGRPGKFNVEIPKIRGSSTSEKTKRAVNHTDFYTIIPKECSIKSAQEVDGKKNIVGFDTEVEATNFINYLKTDFARFCVALLKFDANIQKSKLRFLPNLDFSQEWTDEKLSKHFGIDDQSMQHINDIIPKYY